MRLSPSISLLNPTASLFEPKVSLLELRNQSIPRSQAVLSSMRSRRAYRISGRYYPFMSLTFRARLLLFLRRQNCRTTNIIRVPQMSTQGTTTMLTAQVPAVESCGLYGGEPTYGVALIAIYPFSSILMLDSTSLGLGVDSLRRVFSKMETASVSLYSSKELTLSPKFWQKKDVMWSHCSLSKLQHLDQHRVCTRQHCDSALMRGLFSSVKPGLPELFIHGLIEDIQINIIITSPANTPLHIQITDTPDNKFQHRHIC